MNTILLSKDFNGFNNHELKVAEEAIKQQREARDKKFLSQFSKNMNIAIQWDNGNNYPAVVTKVNKKSVEFLYLYNAIKDEKDLLGNRIKTIQLKDINWLKVAVRDNRITPLYSTKEFENYPVTL